MTTMAEYMPAPTGADLTAMKSYFGISGTDEDVRLGLWLTSAIEAADNYLGRDFVDSDGVDEDPPTECKLGCYAYVDAMRDAYSRKIGVTSKKTFQESETYAADVAMSGAMAAYHAAIPYWYPWKEDVVIAGGGA